VAIKERNKGTPVEVGLLANYFHNKGTLRCKPVPVFTFKTMFKRACAAKENYWVNNTH